MSSPLIERQRKIFRQKKLKFSDKTIHKNIINDETPYSVNENTSNHDDMPKEKKCPGNAELCQPMIINLMSGVLDLVLHIEKVLNMDT